MELQIGLRAETAPAFAQATAARNLQLLRSIESTLISVESSTRFMDVMTRDLNEVLAMLKDANVTHVLDPDGAICKSLGGASDIVSGLYASAQAKHQHARSDSRLTGDDGVADAYDTYIASLKRAHDAFEELREWVETHDAILEPPLEGVFSTVDDLFSAMGVKR